MGPEMGHKAWFLRKSPNVCLSPISSSARGPRSSSALEEIARDIGVGSNSDSLPQACSSPFRKTNGRNSAHTFMDVLAYHWVLRP